MRFIVSFLDRPKPEAVIGLSLKLQLPRPAFRDRATHRFWVENI